MTTDSDIEEAAAKFAKANKKTIAKRITNPDIYVPENEPVSVFMAGSPGAGKTEASKWLIDRMTDGGDDILRIDPDELRNEFPGYNGANSFLFHYPVSILVDKIHDLALDQKQSFVLDGTLSRVDKARENIKRSLKRGRPIQILYVYQEPKLAWEFVCAREAVEGRKIRLEDFIEQYFEARNAVNTLKDEFGKEIKVDLLLKNFDNSNRVYKANIDKVDNHVPEKYTPESIERLVGKP